MTLRQCERNSTEERERERKIHWKLSVSIELFYKKCTQVIILLWQLEYVSASDLFTLFVEQKLFFNTKNNNNDQILYYNRNDSSNNNNVSTEKTATKNNDFTKKKNRLWKGRECVAQTKKQYSIESSNCKRVSKSFNTIILT